MTKHISRLLAAQSANALVLRNQGQLATSASIFFCARLLGTNTSEHAFHARPRAKRHPQHRRPSQSSGNSLSAIGLCIPQETQSAGAAGDCFEQPKKHLNRESDSGPLTSSHAARAHEFLVGILQVYRAPQRAQILFTFLCTHFPNMPWNL